MVKVEPNVVEEIIDGFLTDKIIGAENNRNKIKNKTIITLRKKYGITPKQAEQLEISIGKKIGEKQFNKAANILREILSSIGTEINIDDYDGIIVKELPSSDIINKNKSDEAKKSDDGGSGQSDIRLGKTLRALIPHLTPFFDYWIDPRGSNALLNYYLLEIPVFLRQSNLDFLKNNVKTSTEERILESNTTVLVNKQGMRLSTQGSLDGFYFDSFRKLLKEGDFLVIFKKKSPISDSNSKEFTKKRLSYFEAYGIRTKDVDGQELFEGAELLEDLKSAYYYLDTINVVTEDIFDKITIYEDSSRLTTGKNELFYGVPGAGKSHVVKKKYGDDESYIERILFYPDYDYSDFVGQILPKTDNGEVSYPFSPGPFTRILKKAFHDPTHEYFLVIEEINRGNAPAIFGDVFQLLDRIEIDDSDYGIGTSEYSITNLNIAKEIYTDIEYKYYGDKIRIPSNLSIIATMNTSDQNVFTLDTAFQRRWDMKMIKNDFKSDDLEFDLVGTGMKWNEFAEGLNKLIIEKNKHGLSSEDKRLGAYFIKKEDFEVEETEEKDEKIRKIFAEKVLKYLWDDAFKFYRTDVFDEKEVEQFTLEFFIDKFVDEETTDKFSIFTNEARSYIGLEEKPNQGQEDAK